jgi:hypothetical protein
MQLTYRGINYQLPARQPKQALKAQRSIHCFTYRGVAYTKCAIKLDFFPR